MALGSCFQILNHSSNGCVTHLFCLLYWKFSRSANKYGSNNLLLNFKIDIMYIIYYYINPLSWDVLNVICFRWWILDDNHVSTKISLYLFSLSAQKPSLFAATCPNWGNFHRWSEGKTIFLWLLARILIQYLYRILPQKWLSSMLCIKSTKIQPSLPTKL